MLYVKKKQLLQHRTWRNAWKINQDLAASGGTNMATKTYVTDKDGAVADASTITMPSDKHFRNAWKLNGSVMAEDMAEAKKIFQEKIREVRATS